MSSPIISCACGCGQRDHWKRMKFLGENRQALVLSQCAPFAIAESAARSELQEVVIGMRGRSFIRRWFSAGRVFRLKLATSERLRPNARELAWRSTFLFCLPRSVGPWLSARWSES